MVILLSRTFSTDENYYAECDLALIELTDQTLEQVLTRRKLLLELHQKDTELSEMYFLDALTTSYISASEFAAITKDQLTTLYEGGEEYFEFDGDAEAAKNLQQRTVCDQMIISDMGVQWSCIPKYTNMRITTPILTFEQIEEWFNKSKEKNNAGACVL